MAKEKSLELMTESREKMVKWGIVIGGFVIGIVFFAIFVSTVNDGSEVYNEELLTKYRETGKGVPPLPGTRYWFKGDSLYFSLGMIFFVGPYGIYETRLHKKLNMLEDKFPDFLKDLAEYWKGGLSMTAAIDTISRGEYGGLNKEVAKMARQISWGVSFGEVLTMFSERVNTSIVKRSVSLVVEANKAGGKIADILGTAANDAREIRFLKEDRVKNLSAYAMVCYIAFFVYLAVIAIIAGIFLPAITKASAGLDLDKPIGSIQINDLNEDELNFLFFSSAVVQSTGIGLMAGAMTDGTVAAGCKHGLIMNVVSMIVFKFMIGI